MLQSSRSSNDPSEPKPAGSFTRSSTTLSTVVVVEPSAQEKKRQSKNHAAENQVRHWKRLSTLFRVLLVCSVGIVVVIAGNFLLFKWFSW